MCQLFKLVAVYAGSYDDLVVVCERRVLGTDKLRQVTNDAKAKTHFLIVDCVGVTEKDLTESRPLDRQPSVSFQKLLNHVAMGGTDPDVISSLASRLTRLERGMSEDQKGQLTDIADGTPLSATVRRMVDAIDPDVQVEEARKNLPDGEEPNDEQLKDAYQKLVGNAVTPFLTPDYRNLLFLMKQQQEQVIDTVSQDEVVRSDFSNAARERARTRIESFRTWVKENKDEISALQVLYSGKYANRLTYTDIKDIASRIKLPPLNETPESLWHAYELLEGSVRQGGSKRMLIDLISLIRHAVEEVKPLLPFRDAVMDRYVAWRQQQADAGVTFVDEQSEWLDKIADHIATSLTIEIEDFDLAPFDQEGGRGRLYKLFGDKTPNLIKELNESLVA